MPRVRAEKKYNTFIKGLVTEANSLTFPENASLDEDNFVLKRDGSRERRLGVDFESGHSLVDTGFIPHILETGKQSFHKWDNPSGDSSVSIGVVRVGNKLWFLDLLTDTPSANLLNGGAAITLTGLGSADIATAVVNNYLIIVSQDLSNPIALYYDRVSRTIAYEAVVIQVRDTWGILDGLGATERPATLSKAHEYNLRNQGWVPSIPTTCFYGIFGTNSSFMSFITASKIAAVQSTYNPPVTTAAIQCTRDHLGGYPSNSDIWSLGKVGDASSPNFEKYDPPTMARNSLVNTAAPRGGLILSAFERGASRRALLGSDSLPLDKENGRITTIASFAGRVFYSGVESNVTDGDGKSPNYSNCIFFSQVVTDSSKLGLCYQEADPTSDKISDIIDTDGGVIQIPEATKIVRIISTRSSLLVFAENGVWEIFGDTQGFVATSYQSSKIGSNGCSSPRSVVESFGTVVAWTKAGIYQFSISPMTGRYLSSNISLTSVQTFYNSLSEDAKRYAVGFYDEKENTIRWLYNDLDSYSGTKYVNRYNRELVFDLTLQAFYPQSVDTTLGPYVADYVDIPNYSVVESTEPVYVGSDAVSTATDEVITPVDVTVARTSQFSFLIMANGAFTIGKYSNRDFVDWKSYDGVGIDYLSYLLTGYEVFGSAGSKKQVPYIWLYYRRTENGLSEISGQLELDNPSGSLVQAQWEWTDSANSGKWGNAFQGYKLTRPYNPTGAADNFDYGHSVVVTKNRLRGSGRALSLLIQSETGKDMKLLGWSLLVEVGR